MRDFMEYLNSIYEQINVHLLEQDKKRDQMITFYIVLFSFVITSGQIISKTVLHSFNLNVVYLLLFLIGFLVLRNLVDLRNWHRQYLDSIKIINWIKANQNRYGEDILAMKNDIHILVEAEDKKPNKNKYLNPLFLLSSTDNIIILGMIVLTTVPIIPVLLSFEFLNIVLIYLIYLVMFYVVLILIQHYLINSLYKGSCFRTWILDFGYGDGRLFEETIFQNKYMTISSNNSIPAITENTGGVVIIPVINEKILLIKIKRIDGNEYLELPRGFKENTDDSHSDAAIRELNEELSIPKSAMTDIHDLQKITPDSGLIKSDIRVFAININHFNLEDIRLQNEEKVSNYELLSMSEINTLIASAEITDAFTISALSKWINKKA